MYEIKPLEWKPDSRYTATAKALDSAYFVHQDSHGCYWKRSDSADTACASLDAAKAACEADWRGRVAACLVDRSGELAALVEAAEDFMDVASLGPSTTAYDKCRQALRAAVAALEGK